MLYINCRFLTQNLTGVQRFGFEVVKQLSATRSDIQCLVKQAEIRDNYAIGVINNVVNVDGAAGHIWEQRNLRQFLKQKNNPLLLGLCNTGPLYYKNQIVTIHDLSFEHGNWHSLAFRTFYKAFIPMLAKQSRHVLTVSEFSKSEIIKHYGIQRDKISVIYNAPFAVTHDADFLAPQLPGKPYILSVGSIDPRKNLKRLIKAYLKLNNPDVELLLIGAKNKNFSNDKELAELLKANGNISFLGYKTDAELQYYYQNALFFVYPALYEGFGLPPIEAMSFGCPAIVSGITSLPEVCGDAALYCQPESIDDIYDKMNYLLNNKSIATQMILKGKQQAAAFTWERSANKLNTVLNQFL